MSGYWISDDWSVQVKTLESYLRDAMAKGATDHLIRASEEYGTMRFYIHPANQDGETIDYKVDDNQVYPADPRFERPDDMIVVFMRLKRGDSRLVKADCLGGYINGLERLRRAVEQKDDAEIERCLFELREADEELDRRGGLGLEWHAMIREALEKIGGEKDAD